MRQSSGYEISYSSFGYAFAALAVLASLALGTMTLLVGTPGNNAVGHPSMNVQQMTTDKPKAENR
ncbi:hypothetical protein [Pseudonocardia spinosispora]|uniref:hypothetical protein n=1 Tax=Pseudonocardia spinosispora TaxID=103441 RepID=UPI0004188DF2|nr:hypothetical protein [Pseudonocardia spinosispora]